MSQIKRGGLLYNLPPRSKFVPEAREPGRLRRLWWWLFKKRKVKKGKVPK